MIDQTSPRFAIGTDADNRVLTFRNVEGATIYIFRHLYNNSPWLTVAGGGWATTACFPGHYRDDDTLVFTRELLQGFLTHIPEEMHKDVTEMWEHCAMLRAL